MSHARYIFLIVFLVIIIVMGALYYALQPSQNKSDTPEPLITSSPTPTGVQENTVRPSDEAAEITGFNFIQDFIESAPPEPDPAAQQRAYDALSDSAKQRVSEDTISRDLALFIGVQDVPDQGASVEDLQIQGEDRATLIVGLNYSGGRQLRAVNMVVENGVWKVDSVDELEQYP